MDNYIYRYISFASFVDMVQTQSLNFVLPTVWEDTYENAFLRTWYQKLEGINHPIAALFENIMYAQCWTLLSESDAMWRIYSYDNQSLRIKISISDAEKLENVSYLPVTYSDKQIDYSESALQIPQIMKRMIAQKRIAFRHEEEVRLIYVENRSSEDIISALKTAKLVSMVFDESRTTHLPDYSLEEIEKDTINFNINRQEKNHLVSFSHIPDFIKGVLVNPHAPAWYVKMIKTYCEINKINFEGKSKLYEREINE